MILSEKILMIGRRLPSALTGSAFVARNLARQFSADELLIAGEAPIGWVPEECDEDRPQQTAIA